MGRDNSSHVSLQDLRKDLFAVADLYGKFVNTSADISPEKISSLGIFKMLVSGDTIGAQRKYGQPFSYRNIAKLIFSATETDDRTYAFYKRWIILNFDKVFRENKDTSLIDKLKTPEELSGLLNLALIALKQLQKENGFRDSSIHDTMRKYNNRTDTITRFLEERCIVDLSNPEYYTLTSTVYNEYVSCCKEKDERPLGMNVFGSKLKEHGIEKERIRIDGTREYCYNGVILRSEYRKEPANSSRSVPEYLTLNQKM